MIVVALGLLFVRMPTSFLPEEDQGVMFNQVMLPAGATQERTSRSSRRSSDHFLDEREGHRALRSSPSPASASAAVAKTWASASSTCATGASAGARHDVKAIAGRAMAAFSQIREAMVFAFVPPAVIELGTSGGFTVQMQDRSGLGHDALVAARNQFLGMAEQDKRLVGVRPNGQEDMPEYQLEIDHAKAGALGVSVASINDTLSTAWGGSYVNDFLDRGRIKKVYLQAEAAARMTPDDLKDGTCATCKAKWCRSRPSPRPDGVLARRFSNASMGSPLSNCSARQRPGSRLVTR
jgi:multidrug efflux pump